MPQVIPLYPGLNPIMLYSNSNEEPQVKSESKKKKKSTKKKKLITQ